MKTLLAICNGMDKLYKFFFYLAGAVLAALLGITFFVVFGRLVSIFPIWGDELQRFLMVAMVFISIPYMANKGTFLVVDLTAIFFNKKIQFHKGMLLAGDFIFLGLLIYLVFPCLELAVKNTHTYSTALRLPMVYMYGLMPASFGLGAVATAKNLVKRLVIDRHVEKEAVKQ